MTDSTENIGVKVVLQAGLRKYGGGARARAVSLPVGATLNDLISRLEMAEEDVWVVGVNGVLAKRDNPLSNGDVVEFFEPIAGG